jgi:hypothetical protein
MSDNSCSSQKKSTGLPNLQKSHCSTILRVLKQLNSTSSSTSVDHHPLLAFFASKVSSQSSLPCVSNHFIAARSNNHRSTLCPYAFWSLNVAFALASVATRMSNPVTESKERSMSFGVGGAGTFQEETADSIMPLTESRSHKKGCGYSSAPWRSSDAISERKELLDGSWWQREHRQE